jgi:hypothetical protein
VGDLFGESGQFQTPSADVLGLLDSCDEGAFDLVVPLSSSKGFDESLGNLCDGLGVFDINLEGDCCASRGDRERCGGSGCCGGLVGGVDGYIGHRSVVVERAGVVFAEEGVLADMALRELVVEQEEKAVKALAGHKVELGDAGPTGGRRDEVGNEWSLRRP